MRSCADCSLAWTLSDCVSGIQLTLLFSRVKVYQEVSRSSNNKCCKLLCLDSLCKVFCILLELADYTFP